MLFRSGWIILWAIVAGLGCGRNHVQSEGAYAFTATQELSDDCNLLSNPDDLWDGELLLTGHVLRMKYDLNEMVLAGAYLEVAERFVMDGSVSQITQTLNGRSCEVDQLKVHMEGASVNATTFEGPMRVTYETLYFDACNCVLSVNYRATRK